MGKSLQINSKGYPEMLDVIATVSLSHYDETVPVTTDIGVAGTGYDADHKVFTLPNGKTYDNSKNELKVEANGNGQIEGVDFDYEVSPTATTITFTNAQPNGRKIRFMIIEGS